MREVKFRGYNIESKKWLIGGLLEFKDGTIIMPDGEIDDKMATSPVDRESVGEYLPFNDIDGDQVCEGDIIQQPGNSDWNPKFEIRYDINTGSFQNSLPHSSSNEVIIYKMKIIGNVYENPGLI